MVTCKTCDKREFQTGREFFSLCGLTKEHVWSYVQKDITSNKCPLRKETQEVKVALANNPVQAPIQVQEQKKEAVVESTSQVQSTEENEAPVALLEVDQSESQQPQQSNEKNQKFNFNQKRK